MSDRTPDHRSDSHNEPEVRSYGRRQADYEEVIDTRTRVAVLEKIAENHENRISDMEDFHRTVVERLDQKIQMDATNQVIIERTLTKAVTSIDSLSENLKSALDVANRASDLASKHETIGTTIIKIAGWISIFIGALWAVVQYLVGA